MQLLSAMDKEASVAEVSMTQDSHLTLRMREMEAFCDNLSLILKKKNKQLGSKQLKRILKKYGKDAEV